MKIPFFRLLREQPSLGVLFLFQVLVMVTIGLFSLYLFLELAEEVSEKSVIVEVDDWVLSHIEPGRYPILEKVLIWLTHLASWQGIVIVSVIVFIFLILKKYYYLAIEIVLVSGGSITANVILKNIFNRPRPEGSHAVEVISSSFPSGHSMVGCALYGFLIFMVWEISKDRTVRIFFTSFLLLLIVVIGFSRVYLKVHYPSDVIGGFAAGLFWLALSISIVHIARFFIKRKAVRKTAGE